MLRFVTLILLICTTTVYADDLDDGIGIDTPINDDIDLDKNIQFIVRKALARAKTGEKNGTGSGCGSGNITIGAGSRVKEVINVSNNKGTTAVCSK
jgi:hypothetical protein